MIRVTLHVKDGLIRGFACKGHAGYAEAGRDIVCAAVSALTTTCANALESVAGVRPSVAVSDGEMRLSLSDPSGDAQVILKAMRQGLGDIAEQYPDCLQLTERSV